MVLSKNICVHLRNSITKRAFLGHYFCPYPRFSLHFANICSLWFDWCKESLIKKLSCLHSWQNLWVVKKHFSLKDRSSSFFPFFHPNGSPLIDWRWQDSFFRPLLSVKIVKGWIFWLFFPLRTQFRPWKLHDLAKWPSLAAI